MKTLPVLLLLLFHIALAESTPADPVSCRLSAYDVENYARTVGRSSLGIRLSTSGSCRIERVNYLPRDRRLSLEAIPGVSSLARCQFVLYGTLPLANGWQIRTFEIGTNSSKLRQMTPNKFELEADDPGKIGQALITTVTLRGPDCSRWREAFELTMPAGDPSP